MKKVVEYYTMKLILEIAMIVCNSKDLISEAIFWFSSFMQAKVVQQVSCFNTAKSAISDKTV